MVALIAELAAAESQPGTTARSIKFFNIAAFATAAPFRWGNREA
jgi:hypothetical protein